MINKTHSAPEFHEIIKGRLIHINIQSIATSEITNIFSYYGYHHNKKYDNNQLEAHINLVNQIIINEKLENILYLGDFNYVTEKIDRSNIDSKYDDNNLIVNKWKNFQASHNLKDTFRYKYPELRRYTCTTKDKKRKS